MSKRTWSETYADGDNGDWTYEISAEVRDGVDHIGVTVRNSATEISVDLDAWTATELRDRLSDAIAHVEGK